VLWMGRKIVPTRSTTTKRLVISFRFTFIFYSPI
jgi:hypothetical protein